MCLLNEKQAALFTDCNWGVIATIREDGSPLATPVWIDSDGENALVNNTVGKTKVKNIGRDPRATVTVPPAADQQSGFVMVRGAATIVEEGALESTCSRRNTWELTARASSAVIIKIQHPERVDGYGAGV